MNGETLPPGFDVREGFLLSAGEVIPLASFSAGDYRLAITVTDNEGSAEVTPDVFFTIEGS